MKWNLSKQAEDGRFIALVEHISGQNVSECYQCGKCSGGCPVVADTGLAPNRVIRQVQLGMVEDALSNDLVWGCAGCNTCTSRCPEGVDIARVIDAVRAIALNGNVSLPSRSDAVRTFYRAFLDSVRDFGRLSEVGLMGGYNINSGRFWTNMAKAPWFLFKGKIGVTAHKVKNLGRLERMYKRIEEIERREMAEAGAGEDTA
jgi:heterodisulfide reductase subunit C